MTFTIAAMPAFNEERAIAKMVLGCKKYVDKVVVVDDGSSDATAEIAEALGAYVVRHNPNRGYGAALKSCFETARKLGADNMVIIDSDGQHDPAEIPKLLPPLYNGADIVIGSRFVNGNGKNIPAYRKVGMKVLDTTTNFVGGINVSDSQSGFRAYGKKAIEKIRVKDNDMSAGSEILMQIKRHNLKFEEVEIHCRYDVEGASSQNPVSHGVKVLVKVLRDMEFNRPLYYFTIPGMALGLMGLVLGIFFLRIFYLGGSLNMGYILMMILFVLIGMFMSFTGIILHSISRLLIERSDHVINPASAVHHYDSPVSASPQVGGDAIIAPQVADPYNNPSTSPQVQGKTIIPPQVAYNSNMCEDIMKIEG